MILQSSQEPTPTWHLIFSIDSSVWFRYRLLKWFHTTTDVPFGPFSKQTLPRNMVNLTRRDFWHQFGQRSEVEKTNRTTDTMFVNVENNDSSEKVETSSKASDLSLDIKTLSEECSYNIDWGIVLSGMQKYTISLSLSKYLDTHTYIFMHIPYRPYTMYHVLCTLFYVYYSIYFSQSIIITYIIIYIYIYIALCYVI